MKNFQVFVHLMELRVGAPFASTGISGLSTGWSPALDKSISESTGFQYFGKYFEYFTIRLISSISTFELLFKRKPKNPI
jgi:hypothetical protein